MNISASLAILFIIWWLVFFCVLPFGVRSQGESGDYVAGTESGAPVAPNLLKKMIITTLIACIIFGLFSYSITSGLLDFENLPNFRGK